MSGFFFSTFFLFATLLPLSLFNFSLSHLFISVRCFSFSFDFSFQTNFFLMVF